MTEIEKYIYNQVVASSGDVIKYCVESLKITEENARKRIQRLSGSTLKIKGICKNRQVILYNKDRISDENFYETLIDVLKNNAFQHYLIINALRLHAGMMLKEKLAAFTMSPTENAKGHKNFKTVVEDLQRMNLVRESFTHYYLSENDIVNEKKAHAIELIQSIALEHFHNRIRNIGMISYDSAILNGTFSRYKFALVAPSYIKSLVGQYDTKAIPAFVVADVLLDQHIEESDVTFIVKKMENILMTNQVAKTLPFLLINTHKENVYSLLKRNGIIVANIDELFGKDYSNTLNGILNLLENAGAILKKDPKSYLTLIDNIEKLAIGKTYNLKGELFEMTVGLFHSQQCQSLDISKKIYYDSKEIEVDVYAVYQDKVVFAECKGYNYPIDNEYIQQWITEKIPTVRKWALSCESLSNKKIVFEIWCTGGFLESSQNILIEAGQKTKKYLIQYFDLNKMNQVAKEQKMTHFRKVLRSYYTKEIY